jgi:hypothetical protein
MSYLCTGWYVAIGQDEKMSQRSNCMRRPNRTLKTSELQICELIPGERILSRESIDRWKNNIAAGKFEEPTIIKALGGYYVTQGNHRIFAAKELGLPSVTCQIAQVDRQKNVEALDDIDCADALRAGLLGFEGLKIVATDHDREEACEEEASEDDPIFDDALGDL